MEKTYSINPLLPVPNKGNLTGGYSAFLVDLETNYKEVAKRISRYKDSDDDTVNLLTLESKFRLLDNSPRLILPGYSLGVIDFELTYSAENLESLQLDMEAIRRAHRIPQPYTQQRNLLVHLVTSVDEKLAKLDIRLNGDSAILLPRYAQVMGISNLLLTEVTNNAGIEEIALEDPSAGTLGEIYEKSSAKVEAMR